MRLCTSSTSRDPRPVHAPSLRRAKHRAPVVLLFSNMAKKVPRKLKEKRQKRPRSANKKVPKQMSYLENSLEIWGRDSRVWLEDPLIWSSRGRPNATMPIPTYGWIRIDDGRHHQVQYGTELSEPEDAALPSTNPPTSPSSQIPVDIGSDRQEHSISRHAETSHDLDGTFHIMSNEGERSTLYASNSFPSTMGDLSFLLHDIMRDLEGSESGCSAYTTPESCTPSDSLSYTTSPSSTGSTDRMDDATTIYNSASSRMGLNNVTDNSSSPVIPHISSSLTTFQSLQQQYFPSNATLNNSYPGTTIPTSMPYSAQNTYASYSHPAPSEGQNWSQSMSHMSQSNLSSNLSTPTPILYPNMDDHSLAPMIPHVSAVPSHPNTYSAPPVRGQTSRNNTAGPSRVNLGRRNHTIPSPASNGQASRSVPMASSRLANYGWNTSYLVNGLHSTVSSLDVNTATDPASGSQSNGYVRGTGSSDGMPRWDLSYRDPRFPQ